MVKTVAYLDGQHHVMELSFSSEDAAMKWCLLASAIKRNASELVDYIEASGGRYDRMSAEQRAFGESWLQHVNQLRGMGHGLPPTIEEAENNYNAVKAAAEGA